MATSASDVISSTYRSAPLLLNLERDEATGRSTLASTWCNLGLWPAQALGQQPPASAITSFRHACAALAHAVGKAAKLAEGEAVLDVGVGYADQTAVWVEEFGVRRVVAFELSEEHVIAAREAQQQGRLPSKEVVELHVGSATTSLAAQMGPQAADSGFDAVLCLDCAYHFRTRAAFLREAATRLRCGGRVAAADLTLGAPPAARHQATRESSRPRHESLIPLRLRRALKTMGQRAVAALCDIPSANLVTGAEYADALHAAGFQDVSVTPVTERVFAPFAAHVERQRATLRGQLRYGEAAFLWLIATLFTIIARYELFTFVLVSASKPPATAAHEARAGMRGQSPSTCTTRLRVSPSRIRRVK